MHRLLYGIFFLLFNTVPLSLFAQDYLIQERFLGIEEGLSNRFVYDAVQDNLGFMWFGTRYGLNRYDGYQFEAFTAERNGLQNSFISRLHKDQAGRIWVGGTRELSKWGEISHLDILHPERLSFQSFQSYFGKKAPLQETDIRQMYDNGEEVLLVTHSEELYRYHSERGFEQLFDSEATDSIRIKQVLHNEAGYWIVKDDQLLLLEAESQQVRTLVPKNVYRIAALQNPNAVAYEEGEKPGRFVKISPQGQLPEQLVTHSGKSPIVNFLLRAEPWQGLELLLYSQYFQLRRPDGKLLYNFRPPYTFLRDYHIDRDGNIWLAFDGGIQKISLRKNHFRYPVRGASTRYIGPLNDSLLMASAFQKRSFSIDAQTGDSLKEWRHDLVIDALAADSTHLWIVDAEEGLEYFNWRDKSSRFFPLPAAIEPIWALAKAQEKGLWMATSKGMAYFDLPSRQGRRHFSKAPFERLNNSSIYQILPLGENYWLASSSGLYEMNQSGAILRCYAAHASASHLIPHSYIHHLHVDDAGLFWLATRGGGLVRLNPKDHSYKQYTKQQGLSHNLLYSILEDDFGKLWISSNYGLMRFDKETEAIQLYLAQDGLIGEEFNLKSAYKDSQGRLFFGGIDGILFLNPQDFLRDTAYSPPLHILRYEQFDGKKQTVVDRTQELQKLQRIQLAPNDAFFILDLALLDYSQPEQNRFAYRIEGLDQDWNYLSGHRLRINRLPAGSYTLRLKARGQNGRWSSQERALEIDVQEVFYKQGSFIALMLLLVLLLLLLYWRWRIFRFRRRQRELEDEVAKRTAQIERDKKTIEAQAATLKELDTLKSRFFTNISHELRTPLTLMLGPVAAIQREQYGRNFEKIREVLAVVADNGERLQVLINEILSLSKLEAQGLQLEQQALQPSQLLRKLFQQFEPQAALQGIAFSLHDELPEDLVLSVDIKKLEKIIHNLLSNALKFTERGKQIQLRAQMQQTGWQVEVVDSGSGIHPKDLPHIFQRFYQSQQTDSQLQGGSGIGLALAKELAKLLGGQLSVQTVWQEGSTFRLCLPLEHSDKPPVSLQTTIPRLLPQHEQSSGTQKQHLLVVEDNAQLRQFLCDLLQAQYQISAVDNGAKAWHFLQEGSSIDLLLSDVMMPEMDGFELLKRVKKELDLPVVLLTARATKADQLEALRIGVDDYLTKPFDAQELLLRIQRLLENSQRRLEARAEQEPLESSLEALPPEKSSVKDNWLETVERIMRQELQEPSFGINELAQRMHLSERQFRRRLKEQVGLSPNKYLISVRLQVARELLEAEVCTDLASVAQRVGYKNAQYFARKYKETYGRSPEDYFL